MPDFYHPHAWQWQLYGLSHERSRARKICQGLTCVPLLSPVHPCSKQRKGVRHESSEPTSRAGRQTEPSSKVLAGGGGGGGNGSYQSGCSGMHVARGFHSGNRKYREQGGGGFPRLFSLEPMSLKALLIQIENTGILKSQAVTSA